MKPAQRWEHQAVSARGRSLRTGGAMGRLLGRQGLASLTEKTGFSSVGFSYGCDKVRCCSLGAWREGLEGQGGAGPGCVHLGPFCL